MGPSALIPAFSRSCTILCCPYNSAPTPQNLGKPLLQPQEHPAFREIFNVVGRPNYSQRTCLSSLPGVATSEDDTMADTATTQPPAAISPNITVFPWPKSFRRRASAACSYCQWRKIRCNVEAGSPCNNCKLENIVCRITKRRMTK